MSMTHFDKIIYPKPIIYNVKKKHYDDNIYTFDIETISLFYINGEWVPFNYNFDSKYYTDVEKACCPYIWQFGVNDKVYYGREFMDFEKVLRGLSDPYIEKIIYVHNLSYEMQFLLDIICKNNWTIDNMCARQIRQPISFHIKEINITFRCSYMLTNLSLEAAAEKYTDVVKAVGSLNYNLPYSPYSELPAKAWYYCEMDIVSLYKIVARFREEYGHIKAIPLTQTGEVRKSLRDYIDFYYIKRQWELVPPQYMYCMLLLAFQGGITHANMLYANRVVYNVWSYDFCSSYPYVLVAYKFPSEPFFSIRESEIDRYKENYCFLYDITLKNVRSKKHNHYLSFSKLTDIVDDMDIENDRPYRKCVDNGRLVKIKSCRTYCTNYDLECIRASYDCEVIYNHIWVSYAKYLDKRIIEFILERYVAKTTLKGVDEDSTEYKYYMKMKQELNSIFGMAVTNPLKTGIEYDNINGWYSHDLQDFVNDGKGGTVRFIDKKLADMKKSYSTLFFYGVGVFCTSIARYNLWMNVLALDNDVVYYDTDSIKGIGDKVVQVVADYNKSVLSRLEAVSGELNIPLDKYMPADRKGVKHPLGVFECETDKGNYKQFKTMGAKKYCYVDHEGNMHMTVSGVRKKACKALNGDINNFKRGFVFGYEAADKLLHFYTDEQPPIDYRDTDGNIYHCKQQHSIILQPTTYTLGLTDEYEYILTTLGGMVRDI